jgi:hypothetical protein
MGTSPATVVLEKLDRFVARRARDAEDVFRLPESGTRTRTLHPNLPLLDCTFLFSPKLLTAGY